MPLSDVGEAWAARQLANMTTVDPVAGVREEWVPPPEEPPDVDARPPVDHERPSLGPATDVGPPQYADVAGLLAGTRPEPIRPVLLHRTDGHALLYAGKVNLLYGDPESGKTMLALAACVEAMLAGRRVVIVDLDHNGVESVVPLLLMLGGPSEVLADPNVFRYYDDIDSAGEMLALVDVCTAWRPAVIIVDSIGELMPLLGRDSNSADDFTHAFSAVLKPLAKAGACVVGVDHLAKNPTSRLAGPTGSAAKRRALNGVSLRVVIRRQFVPGQGGTADLFVNKDRLGGVRQHCPVGGREQDAGRFTIAPADANGAVAWRITPPQGRATLSDDVARHLDAARQIGSGITDLAVAAALHGDSPTRAQTRTARERLDELVDLGQLDLVDVGGKGRGKKRVYAVPENAEENAGEELGDGIL